MTNYDHDRDDDRCSRSNRKRRKARRRGPISRVVRGLSKKLNVHKHLVIAGFVLGFIFVPMLTIFVFLGALYWANDPEALEERIDGLARKARTQYKKFAEGPPPRVNDAPTTVNETEFRLPEFPELRRKFEELEARTGKMEACVASEEFTLNRQFRSMGR